MIAWLKAAWETIKANKILILVVFIIGFVVSAFTIAPMAAGIQAIKDKVKFADKKVEQVQEEKK